MKNVKIILIILVLSAFACKTNQLSSGSISIVKYEDNQHSADLEKIESSKNLDESILNENKNSFMYNQSQSFNNLTNMENCFEIVLNEEVQKWITFFSGNPLWEKWLCKSKIYVDVFKKILREYEIPEEIAYLPIIESGFSETAVSYAGAVGMWQFIAPTAKKYGLKINNYLDERLNPYKSAIAAAKYLKDLYKKFKNWELALAGYNGGEGRIAKAIEINNTRDFWKLDYLRKQTKDYVAQFYATIWLVKTLDFPDNCPALITYKTFAVPGALNLEILEKELGLPGGSLKQKNPELLKAITPPDEEEWIITIPDYITEKQMHLAMNNIKEKFTFKTYRVKPADTLYKIARRHKIDIEFLAKINSITDKNKLKIGQDIKIPAYEKNYKIYTLKKGDTLYEISKLFGCELEAIYIHNPGIEKRKNKLSLGEIIKIPDCRN